MGERDLFTRRGTGAQVWNGAGMVSLSEEERKEIAQREADKTREMRSGWPKSIQKEGLPHTYALADEEWGRRMSASRKWGSW